MRPINITGFAGSNQAVHPRLLREDVGVYVNDAEPGRGDLRPLRAAVTVATVPTSPQRQTIWRMGRDVPNDTQYWLSWSGIVHATRGFDAEDPTERTYFTGSGSPKWTSNAIALGSPPYPQASRELAVPAPTMPATVALDVDGDGTESTRYYVHTFVNDIGWESAPSPVSEGVLCKGGASLTISSLPTAPAGNYGITARRIYRTQAGTNNEAEFYFLREIPIGTTSTTDDARALGDALSTTGWLPPPEDAHGLIALWNGMFALLSGKNVHCCPPGAPYAYPVRWDIGLQDTGVATAKWGQNLLVLTTGKPVLIQGQDPEGMSDQPLAMVHPCVSARSVVSFGHGVVWASSEGLAYAGEGGQALLTEGIITERQWKDIVPNTMIAGRYGRFYVASFDDGVARRTMMIDPLNPAGGVWFATGGFDACHYDELADALYVLVGGDVRRFDAGAPLEATFESKRFRQTRPVNYSHAQVVADAYPVDLTVRAFWTNVAGGEVTHVENRTVTNSRAFTLKGGFMADDWQVLVSTSNSVQAVRLATDVKDLQGL